MKQEVDQNVLTPEPTARFEEALYARQAAFPPPRPVPIPIPIPFLLGSRFLIWKQDPSVGSLGLRPVYIQGLVLNGPRDARIRTELTITTPVNRNAHGDFIFASGTPELDCAHTWAVVRQTVTMCQRALGGRSIPWAWNGAGNTNPIKVYPRAGVTANAYYSRSQNCLKFFYFTPNGSSSPVYTCRSLDIVAHETGHAILDGLKPGWLSSGNPPQTGGLHESFGDLTAIFLALSQLDQVEALIAMTKANLHQKNFLAALAEQFGSALGRATGLRNADNDLKLSQVSNQVHAISQVFTGGIYDVLADIFAYECSRQKLTMDPAHVLLDVGRRAFKLLMEAFIQAPNTRATYAHVVNAMLQISHNQGDPPIYRTFIRNRFTFREVVVSPVPLTAMLEGTTDYSDPDFTDGKDSLKLDAAAHPSDNAPQDRSMCCGTMQLPEYMGHEQILADGGDVSEADLMADEIAELTASFK